jgi:hypothetical protein
VRRLANTVRRKGAIGQDQTAEGEMVGASPWSKPMDPQQESHVGTVNPLASCLEIVQRERESERDRERERSLYLF